MKRFACTAALLLAAGCASGPEDMAARYDHGPKPAFRPAEEARLARMKGKEALTRGNAREAIRWYTYLLAVDEKNYEAFAGRGQALFLLSEYQRSLADFDRALSMNDSDWRLFGFRGQAKFKINYAKGAIEDLDKAIGMHDTAGWLFKVRAQAYDALGYIDKARQDRKKFQELGG